MVQQVATSAFVAQLERRWAKGKFLCVGLDTDLTRLPLAFADYPTPAAAVVAFNSAIVDATHDLVCAYYTESAMICLIFWSGSGERGGW
jgi:orotidine-5'-phosphate decarboxylase